MITSQEERLFVTFDWKKNKVLLISSDWDLLIDSIWNKKNKSFRDCCGICVYNLSTDEICILNGAIISYKDMKSLKGKEFTTTQLYKLCNSGNRIIDYSKKSSFRKVFDILRPNDNR